MKIICQIRRSKKYFETNTVSLPSNFTKTYAMYFNLRMVAWKLLFRMSYVEYRRRLAEIAFETIKKNNFDDIFLYYDNKRIEKLDLGTLVIPVDEDDWFSPDLVKTLRSIEDTYEIIIWHAYHDNNLDRGKYKISTTHNFRIVSSCCYGLKTPFLEKKLRTHTNISKEGSYIIPNLLSFKLANPGGISSLIYKNEVFSIESVKKRIMYHISLNLNNDIIYPEEFKYGYSQYKDLLRDLIYSARFDHGDMV